jgi:hypothetical protein
MWSSVSFAVGFNASYKKSIDAKVYLAQLDKRKILSRISGTKEFQNLLTQFHQSQ